MKEQLFYVCDFCEEKSTDRTEIELHETTCEGRPEFKACQSCKNLDYEAWFDGKGADTCLKGCSHFIDYLDGREYMDGFICPEWEEKQ